MRLLRGFVLSLFLTSAFTLEAQRQSLYLSGGWALPNASEYSYISQPTMGVGWSIGWRQSDNWILGIRADAMATHHAIAGRRYSLEMTVEQPITGVLSYFLEAGLSAYSHPYNRTHDARNLFLGSYLNCHIGLGLSAYLISGERRAVSASVRFVHSSNGYLQKPNQGLNYLQGELALHLDKESHTGLAYNKRPTAADLPDSMPANRYFFVSYAPSLVQQRGNNIDAPYCYAHSLLMGALYPLGRLRAVGGDVDLMYNYTHRIEARERGESDPLPLYVGGCATYQRNWHPIFFRVSLGTDLLRSPYLLGSLYERIGFYCKIGGGGVVQPYAGVACKAYYAHIDYIEWTLGIAF